MKYILLSECGNSLSFSITIFVLTYLEYSNFGDLQFYCLETQPWVYIIEKEGWEIDSFLANEINQQIIQNT